MSISIKTVLYLFLALILMYFLYGFLIYKGPEINEKTVVLKKTNDIIEIVDIRPDIYTSSSIDVYLKDKKTNKDNLIYTADKNLYPLIYHKVVKDSILVLTFMIRGSDKTKKVYIPFSTEVNFGKTIKL